MVVDEAIDVVPCFSAALVQQTKLRKDLGNCDTAVIRRTVCTEPRRQIVFEKWSGARDLNPGPHGPEPCALPNCASPRHRRSALPAARPTEGDDSTRRPGPPRS